MHQFFTDQLLQQQHTIDLSREQCFQIFKVLKLKTQELVRIVNLQGVGYRAEITEDQRFRLIDPLNFDKNPRKVTLGLSLFRSEKLELVLQKATELGVDEIVLVDAQRSVVRFDNKTLAKKLIRYQTILKEAAEQAQRQYIPKMDTLLKSTHVSSLNYAQVYYGDLSDKAASLKDVRLGDQILILIGPEGGWSPLELIYFESSNFKAITISKQTLRAETAAIIATHMLVNHED